MPLELRRTPLLKTDSLPRSGPAVPGKHKPILLYIHKDRNQLSALAGNARVETQNAQSRPRGLVRPHHVMGSAYCTSCKHGPYASLLRLSKADRMTAQQGYPGGRAREIGARQNPLSCAGENSKSA